MDELPEPFFISLEISLTSSLPTEVRCAGFEEKEWRSKPYANHLLDWLPNYALDNDELSEFSSANAYSKLRAAAARIYTSEKYETRGEIGEITLHALCRENFGTQQLAPRVHYLSASNDPVKGFDLVHYRVLDDGSVEIWLGESKFMSDGLSAARRAVSSIREHIQSGFLKSEKLLLGPQIPKSTPNYEAVRKVFSANTPVDQIIDKAIFPIGIFASSYAASEFESISNEYVGAISEECAKIAHIIENSDIATQISIVLFYVPLGDKKALMEVFDNKLKALQDG